ncbi:hypothetical protein LIER_13337 [Lithospermum erythrorhizon]|uniref:Uncharacterized protein n=1 Tax=Lithospermum erythrorhizon TaxID=34254 RepID=A0AAV3Q097_LITER
MQAEEYPFFHSDTPTILEELLKEKFVEFPESKRPEEANRSNEPNNCKIEGRSSQEEKESKRERTKLWRDYPSDADHEESCHMYVEIEEIPEAGTTLEAPQATPEIPQSFEVNFTDEDMPKEDGDHNRLLYVSG